MLEINNLDVRYTTENGQKVHAVADGNIRLGENQTLGLVGESGSGKSTFAKSIIRLLARNGEVTNGEVLFQGKDLTQISDKQMRDEVRWSEIAMIPQNAMNGFDPVYTIGKQIVQVIQKHEMGVTKNEAMDRAKELFEKVGLESERVHDYPHQLSGGMAQRAMIAMALSLNPSLILADEPTTALDVVIQDQILRLMKELQGEIDGSMILITHDMSVVSEVCDEVAVMYGGQVVEYGSTNQIINKPSHPYSLGLQNAFPDITKESQDLISIEGAPPGLIDPEKKCSFAPRCPFSEDRCLGEVPELGLADDSDHLVRCVRSDEAEMIRNKGNDPQTWEGVVESEQNIKKVSEDSG